MLNCDNTALVLIDIQGKLAEIMDEKDRLFDNLERLVRGARVLGLPILWCEQNPAALGPTIPQLTEHLEGVESIPKMSFSCCKNDQFNEKLSHIAPQNLLLAGIETHICVYQTAAHLIESGYGVQVVADGVSSRTAANRQIGLDKIMQIGGKVTCTEMALFELLGAAEGDKFKQILKIVK